MINGPGKEDPSQDTKPSGSKPKHTWAQVPLAVVAITLGWVSKLMAAGWLTLFCGIPYLAVGVIHFVVHLVAAAKARNAKPAPFALLLASHTFFILGFLLQLDGGDGPNWLTITYVVGGGYHTRLPSWWGLWMNAVVFVPLVLTWAFLLSRSFSPRD